MSSTTIPTKGRQFDIIQEVTDLLDTLPQEEKRQALAFLAVRYGMQLKDPPAARPAGGFRKSYKRSYS